MKTFRVHMETMHKGQRPFACGQCERKFQTPTALRRHVEISCKHQKSRATINSNNKRFKTATEIELLTANDNVKVPSLQEFRNLPEVAAVNASSNNNMVSKSQESLSDSITQQQIKIENVECLNDETFERN